MLLLAALLAPAPLAAAPKADLSDGLCGLDHATPVDAGKDKAKLRRLDELPPAALMRPVLRRDGDCYRPVVVRYGITGEPRRDGRD